jgi:hypothetical protein
LVRKFRLEKLCQFAVHLRVNRVFCVNEINNLAPGKSGCESCRPSQALAKVLHYKGLRTLRPSIVQVDVQWRRPGRPSLASIQHVYRRGRIFWRRRMSADLSA